MRGSVIIFYWVGAEKCFLGTQQLQFDPKWGHVGSCCSLPGTRIGKCKSAVFEITNAEAIQSPTQKTDDRIVKHASPHSEARAVSISGSDACPFVASRTGQAHSSGDRGKRSLADRNWHADRGLRSQSPVRRAIVSGGKAETVTYKMVR